MNLLNKDKLMECIHNKTECEAKVPIVRKHNIKKLIKAILSYPDVFAELSCFDKNYWVSVLKAELRAVECRINWRLYT